MTSSIARGLIMAGMAMLLVSALLAYFLWPVNSLPDGTTPEALSGAGRASVHERASAEKIDIVLIHSFPTNSHILSGLIEYLSQHFDVHFVDLPGFTKDTRPLQEVSVEAYARYVEARIDGMDLGDYWVGGISFGFLVANAIGADDRLEGVMAIEPLCTAEHLRLERSERLLLRTVVSLIQLAGLEATVWDSRFMETMFFGKMSNRAYADIIHSQVDPRTFFATSNILLNLGDRCRFKNLPYAIIVNPDDRTIHVDKVLRTFDAPDVGEKYVLFSSVEHFPAEISKEYFETHIDGRDLEQLLVWIESRENSRAVNKVP